MDDICAVNQRFTDDQRGQVVKALLHDKTRSESLKI
jgi:hypothetical protein